MRKTKLLVLLSVLLVLATVLCACGEVKGANPKRILTGTYTAKNPLSSGGAIGMPGMDVDDTEGKFVAFAEGMTFMIYNMESGATVYNVSLTQNQIIEDVSYYETAAYELGLFTVTIRTEGEGEAEPTYSTVLYSENGNTIASVTKRNMNVTVGVDLFKFDDTCYRVNEDKSYAEAFKMNDLASYDISDIDYMTEKYYYSFDGFGDAGKSSVFTAYDKEMKPVATHMIPSYAGDDDMCGVLEDGRVIFQYLVEEPEDAEEYDLLDGTQKYTVVTEVYNVKNQKIKQIDMDYILFAVSSRDTVTDPESMETYDDNVVTLAWAFAIKDRRVDENYNSMEILQLNGSGDVKCSLTKMVDGMVMIPRPVAANRYMYSTVDGRSFLMDEDGKQLGEVSGARYYTDAYIVTAEKLYNYDLGEVYDFGAEELIYESHIGSTVFFTKDGETYAYNGALNKIIAKDENKVLTVETNYYMIAATDAALKTTYTYYSANGTQLLSVDIILAEVATYDRYVVLGGLDAAAKFVYYRLA